MIKRIGMQELFSKYKSVIGYINYALCLALLFFAAAPDYLLRSLFNIWLISWALEFRWLDKNNYSFSKPNKAILLFLGYIAWEILSLCWTSEFDEGLGQVGRHFYVVAMALVVFSGVNERYKLKTMLYVFISGAAIVGIMYFVVMYFVFNQGAVLDRSHNIHFVMPNVGKMADAIHNYKLHQNYGLTLFLALIAIPFVRSSLIKDEGRLNAYVLMSVASVLISLCIYFSGCRAILLAMFVCIFIYVLSIIKFKGRIWTLCILALSSVALFFMMKNHPRSKNVSFALSKCISGKFEGNEEPRLLIWHSVYELCGESFFFGSGVGSSREMLVASYKEHNYPSCFINGRWNAHSQYFNSLLELGVFSVFALVAIFVIFPFFFTRRAKIYSVFCMAAYSVLSLTDVMFSSSTRMRIFCIALLIIYQISNEQSYPKDDRFRNIQDRSKPA